MKKTKVKYDMEYHLRNAKRIAKLLDSQFSFLGIKFGLDPIAGLIPGIGDAVTLFLSLYLIWIGAKMDIPKKELLRMVSNVAFDYLVGAIPVLGDIFDVFFKANEKNFAILKRNKK